MKSILSSLLVFTTLVYAVPLTPDDGLLEKRGNDSKNEPPKYHAIPSRETPDDYVPAPIEPPSDFDVQNVKAPEAVGALAVFRTFQDEMLDAHNFFRSQHDAANLTWDDGLAAQAQAWANQCLLQHGSYGENLAWYSIPQVPSLFVNPWGLERKLYNWISPPGLLNDVGHFTQVVWKSTTKVGCAYAVCPNLGWPTATYLVCRYDPPGNVRTRYAANVGFQMSGTVVDVYLSPLLKMLGLSP